MEEKENQETQEGEKITDLRADVAADSAEAVKGGVKRSGGDDDLEDLEVER